MLLIHYEVNCCFCSKDGHVLCIMINLFANYANSYREECYSSLCNKLITIVNYYLEAGLFCIVY